MNCLSPKHILVGVLLGLLVIGATAVSESLAKDRTASWILPTKYADETAIDNTDQARMPTTFEASSSGSDPWVEIFTSEAGASSAVFVYDPIESTGIYFFRAKSCLDNVCSVWSPTYIFAVSPAVIRGNYQGITIR